MRNGADLVVVPLAQDAADQNLVCAQLALGGLVDLHDIVVNLARVHGGRIFSSIGGQDKHEVPLRLHAEIALYNILELIMECVVVSALDGLQVGI
jgi:hypothetical protein